MALVAETLVEEWLNRRGYFTIRGAKAGQGEIDLLAVSFREPEALHVEVSVSARAIGYVSGPPIAKKTPEELEASVAEWVRRKFQGKNEQVARRREELCPTRHWRFMLVYGDLKYPEELPLLERQGVAVKHIRNVLGELRNIEDTRTSSEASGVAELLEICREEHREAPVERPEAPRSENAKHFSLIEGDKLEPGMLVFNLGGNAKNGSVPEGDEVIEEITAITPLGNDPEGRPYCKLHLRLLGGAKNHQPGHERTKYLSMAKRVKAAAQFKGGKTRSRIAPAGGNATCT